MKLPQYLRVKPRIEQTVEMLVSTTNQLIDYLKEREECKNCKTDTLQIIIADKNNDCVSCGRPISKITSPKKIDVEGLLKEYALINDSNYIYFQSSKGRSQQIINQIKDAIK